MTAPMPIISFPNNARKAMTFYGRVFGCQVTLHTFEELGQRGPRDGIAEGRLTGGPIVFWGHDVDNFRDAFQAQGITLSVVGNSDLATTYRWFEGLAERGHVVRELKPINDIMTMGQVTDQFGLSWLVGHINKDGFNDAGPKPDPKPGQHHSPSAEPERSAPSDPAEDQPPRRGPAHTEA